jgi:rod shape determining protein RodA
VHTDFIFAAIAEQLGFVGTITLVSAFAALLMNGLLIAATTTDELGRLVAVGITTLLFTHVAQNIGMNISILPITGVPLPLISYGGSFLVLVLFSLGVLESIWIHRRTRSARPAPSAPIYASYVR